ncbi:hypothetical protein D9758_007056 [Tetrapyrgos nigripes]|uniref:Uncharacterized protein n=1 Tax=Tetrapyrgos nigripes TaxID=182062 RepID=A0A8H5GDJ3_9AGAR|nr:hypothetical protein D9758_007056 [Tetrapyrgos nigripes]
MDLVDMIVDIPGEIIELIFKNLKDMDDAQSQNDMEMDDDRCSEEEEEDEEDTDTEDDEDEVGEGSVDEDQAEGQRELSTRNSLLSCALSCKIFSKVALGFIWHTVTGWGPLLKLIPGCQIVRFAYSLEGELNDASLERFDFYARMVKKFILQDQEWEERFTRKAGIRVKDSVYRHLSLARPRPFPSLTSFECFYERLPRAMMLCVSPHLLEAAFVTSQSSNFTSRTEIRHYLDAVKQEAPLFRKLEISSDRRVLSLASLIHLDVDRFIESIALEYSVDETFLAWSHLTHLEVLKLNEPDLLPKHLGLINTVEPSDFPKRLKALEISVQRDTVINVFRLLELCQYSPVESFQLTGRDLHREYNKIFTAVASGWSESLTSLSITTVLIQDAFEIDSASPISDFLNPLYSLRELRILRLWSLGEVFYVRDKDIRNVCNAWPNLAELVLDADPVSGSESSQRSPTTASFHILAQHCPMLNNLRIPFHKSVPSSSVALPSSTVISLPHNLERLQLAVRGKLTKAHTSRLARHLDLAFPNLKSVVVGHNASESSKAIMKLLKSSQIARRRQVETAK